VTGKRNRPAGNGAAPIHLPNGDSTASTVLPLIAHAGNVGIQDIDLGPNAVGIQNITLGTNDVGILDTTLGTNDVGILDTTLGTNDVGILDIDLDINDVGIHNITLDTEDVAGNAEEADAGFIACTCGLFDWAPAASNAPQSSVPSKSDSTLKDKHYG
jgi:hypothetical protein